MLSGPISRAVKEDDEIVVLPISIPNSDGPL